MTITLEEARAALERAARHLLRLSAVHDRPSDKLEESDAAILRALADALGEGDTHWHWRAISSLTPREKLDVKGGSRVWIIPEPKVKP